MITSHLATHQTRTETVKPGERYYISGSDDIAMIVLDVDEGLK
jgi:hypothetical protein